MVQKELLIDSAISALVEICFPSIFSEAMLVVIAVLESDCCLVSQESDVIGCYNNTFSLLSHKC